MKYRVYCFENGKLLGVELANKLPNGAKKQRGVDVWTTTECLGLYMKVCLNSSDIDFGTGIKGVE